jgi:hypothetical protein
MLILLPSNPFFEKNIIFPKIYSAHSTSKNSYWARVLDRDRDRDRGRGRGRGRARDRGRGGGGGRSRNRGRGRCRGRVLVFMLISLASITF